MTKRPIRKHRLFQSTEEMYANALARHKPKRSGQTINRSFFWTWGKTKSGRNFVRGPCNTEEEAWQILYSATDIEHSESKVVSLPTVSESTATQMVKSMDTAETHQFEQGLRRARHIL